MPQHSRQTAAVETGEGAASRAWEIEVFWRPECGRNPRAAELGARLASVSSRPELAELEMSHLYWLECVDEVDRTRVEVAGRELFSDPVIERAELRPLDASAPRPTPGAEVAGDGDAHVATILGRTGVMDPVEASILRGLEDQGWGQGVRARTAWRAFLPLALDPPTRARLAEGVLANQAVEEVIWDADALPAPFSPAVLVEARRQEVPLEGLDDAALLELSREGQLSLDLEEMRTVRDHFAQVAKRAPSDIELETIAQTWSEHCCHKTLTSAVEHRHRDRAGAETVFRFQNVLKNTIAEVTNLLRQEENPPFCLSVFVDNAGVVAFDEDYGLSFKVETHNHPSAIEPYGGSGTGIGGVLRDTLGTGLGAKPIVNTDVFCLGPPDLPLDRLPPGVLHPLRVLRGVVGGVRDYGNRMGIPTASGALFFDERYTPNPLVFCGSVGIIPRDQVEKLVQPGDRVVVLGGRTGRDGIHGATFSSIELSEESETVSSGAVQIGNAITEKKVLDVLLVARDEGLYSAVTDCGAGGLSSAVGEMAETTREDWAGGARVELARVPLKYEGLTYWEIWISEAQERMVFSVPPAKLERFAELAASEDVELTDIGEFTDSGELELLYEGEEMGRLSIDFLHGGRPGRVRESTWTEHSVAPIDLSGAPAAGQLLKSILSSPNVASKEWVVRQYDHEVQGQSVLKPFQGPAEGPGDSVVFAPRFGSHRGFAVGCGMNPVYGDLDPYRMALSAVDEAVRNVVAAGGDPDRIAVLDNFSWGNTERPETLGGLVEACRGCHRAGLDLSVPFVSGKDSLNNEFRVGGELLSIPPSLLISSLAIVEDVRRVVSMDLKAPGNVLVLVGETRPELGGSHLLRVLERGGGEVPDLPANARAIHRAVAAAIQSGAVRSVHDLSEGGLAVALAEMAFAGQVGAEVELVAAPRAEGFASDLELVFAESNSRYVLEVESAELERVLACFGDVPAAAIGKTIEYGVLRIAGLDGETLIAEPLAELEEAWRGPLHFSAS